MEDEDDPLVYPRIRAIRLNCWERPLWAIIVTRFGVVRVRWREVNGERCWRAKGRPEAIDAALAAIEHVQEMCESIH